MTIAPRFPHVMLRLANPETPFRWHGKPAGMTGRGGVPGGRHAPAIMGSGEEAGAVKFGGAILAFAADPGGGRTALVRRA